MNAPKITLAITAEVSAGVGVAPAEFTVDKAWIPIRTAQAINPVSTATVADRTAKT